MCQREDLGIELEHMEWSNFTAVIDKLNKIKDEEKERIRSIFQIRFDQDY